MNQKVVLISGLVLVSLIIVLSFMVEFEVGPTGELVRMVNQKTSGPSWIRVAEENRPSTLVGHTVSVYPPECEDSDGLDFYNAGQVLHTSGDFVSPETVNYDVCTSSGRYVLEQYCRLSKATNRMQKGTMQYYCKFGCNKGACKTGGRTTGISPAGSGYVLPAR